MGDSPHINLHILPFLFNMCAMAFRHCYQQETGVRVCACESERDCILGRAGPGRGLLHERGREGRERGREADRGGGSIPGGIQTASVLCDRDGDDFIRPASFSLSLSLLSLSLSGCKQACEGDLLYVK